MSDPIIEAVLLDASAAFQITHGTQGRHTGMSGGILLGPDPIDDDGNIAEECHITETFPLPSVAFQSEGANLQSKETLSFQSQMISKLKAVGSDCHVQGWYLCGSSAEIFETAVLENLYSYQKSNPNAVLLVHDAAFTESTGSLSLRAFRLTPKFLQIRKELGNPYNSKLSTDRLVDHEMTYEDIVEELPIRVFNSHLVNLFTVSQATNPNSTPAASYRQLRLPDQSLVQSNVDAVMDEIDDFNYEQSNYNYYRRQLAREKQKVSQWQQRRKNENQVRESAGKPPLPLDDWKTQFKLPEEPSRLENLLISAQLDEYCGQIEELGALSSLSLLSSRASK